MMERNMGDESYKEIYVLFYVGGEEYAGYFVKTLECHGEGVFVTRERCGNKDFFLFNEVDSYKEIGEDEFYKKDKFHMMLDE